MSFLEMKKNAAKSLEFLTAEMKKMDAPSYKDEDDRFWKLTTDKAGNGYAIIRFLPTPDFEGEKTPFIKTFRHAFKGPGGWYIEDSLTTIDQADPVSEFNSILWNSTNDDEAPARKQARAQKRQLKFISNIYVIKDPANPENEGKVFLFKYGKKVYDKIKDLMEPAIPELNAPVDPFNLWTGANFTLVQRIVDDYPNFDKSTFDKPSPLADNDEVLEKIYKSEYPLRTEFLKPEKFKSYDELKAKLAKVLQVNLDGSAPTSKVENKMTDAPEPRRASAPSIPTSNDLPFDTDNSDDDDELSYFKKLVNDQ